VPKSEIGNELTVPLDVRALHILEKATTAPDHLEKTKTTVVIFLVGVEVGPEVVDATREDRDLDRGASTISIVELVLLDNFFLNNRHIGVLPPRESVAAREAMSL
jgi:hypothetical protein